MSVILCIETSSVNCSVALVKDGNLLGFKESAAGYSHAENLHVFIKEVLEVAGIDKKELHGIMIGSGPGSFTGLRIGAATAKGLCYALDLPLMSLSSLDNMTMAVRKNLDLPSAKEVVFCPMIDARRMEVYSAQYDGNLNPIKKAEALIIDENTFVDLLENKVVYFFGDGMPKMQDLYSGYSNAKFIDGQLPSALNMIDVCDEKFNDEQFEDAAYYEPFYLKGFFATTPKKLI